MKFQEPNVFLARGSLETPLEEAVKSFAIPLAPLHTPKRDAIKYGNFDQENPCLFIACQSKDSTKFPNLVLTIASYSEERNGSLLYSFQTATGARLDKRFPNLVERELARGAIYNFRVFEKDFLLGLALLRGEVSRDYVDLVAKNRWN